MTSLPEADFPKRVAVITAGVPHPHSGASLVLFYHYIKSIVDAGNSVLSIVLIESIERESDDIESYRQAVGELDHFIVSPVVSGGQILQPSRFAISKNLAARKQILKLIDEYRADSVVVFDIQVAALVDGLQVSKRIGWLGDLGFESNWYHFLYGLREDWKTIRWLPYALAQRSAWKRLYTDVLGGYDHLIVASKSSERALATLGIEAAFAPYPWPNLGAIDRDVERLLPMLPTFLFYGHLFGLGSRSALHFLFSELYPSLVAEWGTAGFRIIIGGRENLPAWVEEEVICRPELDFVGFIEDLTAVMATVHAVIAPLDVPVGNRSRILTAQAKRVLVIAHENAARGNGLLIHGENCLLARSAKDFISCMRIAVDAPAQCRQIIDRAEESYRHHYAPKVAACALAELARR